MRSRAILVFFLVSLGLTTALISSAAVQEIVLGLSWSSDIALPATDIVWGDYDSDGDLDVLSITISQSTNGRRYLIYRNVGGQLETSPVWELTNADITSAAAWADYDNDGDLDFATATSSATNKLYRNDGVTAEGVPTFTVVWESVEANLATAVVAWGDYNNDGRLDLFFGHDGVADDLYRNDGNGTFTRVWQADSASHASWAAWGDYNSDGFLDLVVANGEATIGAQNEMYLSNNGSLPTAPTWTSDEADLSIFVAWGDYDDDGRLDLAVGNRGAPNRIYRSVDDNRYFELVWTSTEVEDTQEVVWVDLDGDRDLDLVTADTSPTEGRVNLIYENVDGVLSTSASEQTAEADLTNGLAAGDVDNDGDFDLLVANGTQSVPQADRVYLNGATLFNPIPVWEQTAGDRVNNAIAWGDVNGDGDLDLVLSTGAIANGSLEDRPMVLFEFEAGQEPQLVWTPTEVDSASAAAWGDMDQDGDLDLVTATRSGDNFIYLNTAGTLAPSASVTVTNASYTNVALADYDNDGDLDILYSAITLLLPARDRLYRNNGVDESGVPMFEQVWQAGGNLYTADSAWVDYDNDGDLDLFMGNLAPNFFFIGDPQPNELYENVGGVLTNQPVWVSPESEYTIGVDVGDYDGDGDLDVAVANLGQPNRVYENQGGTFVSVWTSLEVEATNDVAWVDYDGDGDLDLAVASGTLQDTTGSGSTTTLPQPVRLYRNDNGVLPANATWTGPVGVWQKMTWGDYDQDGDLDVALSNFDTENPSIVLENLGHNTRSTLGNEASYATVQRPDGVPATERFSTPEIVRPTAGYIEIPYTLYDAEGDDVLRIIPEFSPNGGGEWFPATPAAGGSGLTKLAASPNGTDHTFRWDMGADLVKSDNVVFRMGVQSETPVGPIMWGIRSSQTVPFRAEIPYYIRVQDEQGDIVPDALVFVDGERLPTVTDRSGLINPGEELALDTAVVALAPQVTVPTTRPCHDGWSYQVYTSSLTWELDGTADYLRVSESGPQTVVTHAGSPLIGYNLVVSIEWDASEAYLQEMAEAMALASDYLYDVSDGQMALAQVTVYENSECWSGADIQVLAKNIVRPHARIGGILLDDTSAVIRIGRQWDGNGGDVGAWTEPNGYRTIIHEFGHYALNLYDHYFGFEFDDDGLLLGEVRTRCTGYIKQTVTAETDATNATIMDYQYASSEFSMQGVLGLWDENCEATAQWLFNEESDWETIARVYTDSVNAESPAWFITTPLMRGGVLAGPDGYPAVLPTWPEVEQVPSGSSAEPRLLQVQVNSEPFQGALVALYKDDGSVVGQGISNANGELLLYGAEDGDRVQVVSFDGGLSDRVAVDDGDGALVANLTPVGLRSADFATSRNPYLRIIPQAGTAETADLILSLPHVDEQTTATLIVGEPGGTNNTGLVIDMSYSSVLDGYQGVFSFSATKLGTGSAQALVGASGRLQATYRLAEISGTEGGSLISDDGNVVLFVDPNSLFGAERAKFVVNETGLIPADLPAGLQQASEAYSIASSGALPELQRPGVLRLSYADNFLPAGVDASEIQIYRFDVTAGSWVALESNVDDERQEVSAAVTLLGTYVLLYPGDAPPPPPAGAFIYLPLVTR